MAAILLCCAAGCSSIEGTYPRNSPLIPAATIRFTDDYSVSLEKLVIGASVLALAYYVVDPLAPNWEIRETRLGEDSYTFSLRMKRFHTGGDGEARTVIDRRAAQLAREGGFAGFQVLSYREGIESSLVAQRYSEGMVRLVRAAE